MKKLLALVLALVMVMGLSVVSTNAAFADEDKIDHKEAVEVLAALDIINGKGNNQFDPTGDVKRSEMAKMVAIAMLGDVDVSAFTGAPTDLTDIEGHWAEGYIKFCVAQGIVAGRGNGKFEPDAQVTTTEAAKMLLVALGYSSEVRGYTGGQWQVNVTKDAQLKGLFDRLSGLAANHPLNRDETAQMIYNTITATRVIESQQIDTKTGAITLGYTDATNASSGGRTLLTKTFDGKDETGTVTAYTYSAKDKEWTYTIAPDDATLPNYTVVSNKDYTGFYGLNVRALSTYDEKDKTNYLAGMYLHDSAILHEGYFGEIESVTIAGTDTSFKLDGTSYKLDGAANTIPVIETNGLTSVGGLALNGMVRTATPGSTVVQALFGGALADSDNGSYSYKLIDFDGNGKVDNVFVTPFTFGKLTYVSSDNMTVSLQGSHIDASVSGSQKVADVELYDGAAKDDYVMCVSGVYAPKGVATYTKLNVTSGGTLTGTRSAGTEFKMGNNWFANASGTTLNVNDTIDYINLGPVFYYAKVTSGATGTDAVAAVVNIANHVGTGVAGNYVEAKILLADGTSLTGKVVEFNGQTVNGGDTIATNYTGTDASGAAPGAQNLGSLKSNLVRYEKNSDGELSLWSIPAGYANKIMGFDGTLATGQTFNGANSHIGAYELADDAVVFVMQNTNNKGKVISGKELKNNTAGNWPAGAGAVGTYTSGLFGKVNGFTYTRVAVLDGANAYPTINTGNNYAYLTADAYLGKEGGVSYRYFEFWDGEKTVTAKEKDETSLTGFTAGVVITYDTTSDDGVIKNVSAPLMATGAVTGWDNDKKINVTGATNTKVTSDTKVIYVKSADTEGASGAITEAVDVSGDGLVDTNDANVMFLEGGDNTFALIVVDVNQRMQAVASQITKIYTDEDNSTGTVNTQLASTNVKVNATSALNMVAVTIPNGKTLEITSANNSAITLANVTFGSATSKLVINNGSGNIALTEFDTVSGVVELTSTGAISFGTATDPTDITGKVTVTGNLTGGTETLTLASGGQLSVTGNLVSAAALNVTKGTVTIGGNATTTSGITVTEGTVTIGGNITGGITFAGASNETAVATVDGNVDALTDINKGTLNVKGNIASTAAITSGIINLNGTAAQKMTLETTGAVYAAGTINAGAFAVIELDNSSNALTVSGLTFVGAKDGTDKATVTIKASAATNNVTVGATNKLWASDSTGAMTGAVNKAGAAGASFAWDGEKFLSATTLTNFQ